MNTTQTASPPAPPPTQTPLFPTLLADFDDPRLSELDLCRRHDLTPEQLAEAVRRPAFRRALAHLREVRDVRRPHMLVRAEFEAARILETLAARETPTPAAAKEARLACKDHLRLRGLPPSPLPPQAAAFQTAEPPPMQSADSPPPTPQGHQEPDPTPTLTTSTPPTPSTPASPHKPKYPRGTKPRPKARSR